MTSAWPICRSLDMQRTALACSRALLSAGMRMLMSSAMMPMTTSSSTRVKARRRIAEGPGRKRPRTATPCRTTNVRRRPAGGLEPVVGAGPADLHVGALAPGAPLDAGVHEQDVAARGLVGAAQHVVGPHRAILPLAGHPVELAAVGGAGGE